MRWGGGAWRSARAILPRMNTKTRSLRRLIGLVLTLLAFVVAARAEVTRVEVKSRAVVGTSGYEKIIGTVYFAVDPKDARNAVIVDLDKAPTNAAGKVEFSSDLYVLRPLDAARS